ncbi:peroxisomal membrane anchor protein conserved region-domain-containing protein [Hypoxylon sp. FL1150]|nr:peroxisomal membrane anchor protein conserved region-domain-containing protein [Hypoxylon sp. FL1150]
MPVREDAVAQAVSFLQDPSVQAPVENKVSFLRSKNLTQEEIDTAFARVGSSGPVATSSSSSPQPAPRQQPYYDQYPPQPYGWQPPPPPPPPKRDWRDWFIMATVMGGVGYGLYFVSKRYLYPLVSPPTPEKLEQDKATVDEQFEKAFSTLEQLAKDTEELKASEKERTEKLDKVLDELESFMRDTKSASRRHEDETDRLREEMKALKNVIPKSMTANKEFTDSRLKEITSEVKSLKALINRRMTSGPSPSPAPAPASTPGPLQMPTNNMSNGSNDYLKLHAPAHPDIASAVSTPGIDLMAKELGESRRALQDETLPQNTRQDYLSALSNRSSPFSGMPASKAAIPSWQLAAAGGSDEAGGSGSGSKESKEQSAGGGSSSS